MNDKKPGDSIGEKIGGAIGQQVGKHVGKEIENNLTGKDSHGHKKKGKSPIARRVGYVFGILFALVFLWIFNNYEAWGWRFMTDAWSQVDGIVRTSIYVSLIVYGIFLVLDPRLVFYIGKLVMDVFSFIVSVRLFQVFPFDFSGRWNWLDTLLPVLLILGMIAIVVGFLVRTSKLAAGKDFYD